MFTTEKSIHLLDVIGKSAKYVVTGIATYFVLCTDSWLPMYYILGGVLNAITGKTLKSIIRQPRPADSPKKGSLVLIFDSSRLKK